MMLYSLLITIKCKNKKSIFYFSLVLIKFFKNILIRYNKSLKNVSRFTLLKSPHVHKSAQHEFKQQIYKKQLLFILFSNTTLIFFKKLFFYFFQDIRKNCIFNFQIHDHNTYLNCIFFKINIVNTLLFLSNTNSCATCSSRRQDGFVIVIFHNLIVYLG